MRINDYKLVLDPIPDHDLDQLIAVRSDNDIHFEPAEAPPERWNHFLGVIVHAPSRTTPENGSPEPQPEIAGLDAHTLASEQFLPGFMQDLSNEFGDEIAAQCLTHPGLTGATPITARTVKEVIAQAEQAFQAGPPAHIVDRVRSYLDHGMWNGVIASINKPDDPSLLGEAASQITEPLRQNAEEFVLALIGNRCLALPRNVLAALSIEQFVEIAKGVLDLYNEIRTLPMMTKEALEITFENAVRDITTWGVDEAVRRLPMNAATACFRLGLNPDTQAVWRSWKGEHPGASKMVLARIQAQILLCFAQIRSRSTPAGQNTCREVFDHLISQVEQSFDEILSDYLRLQTAIETSSAFSPRQKQTLIQWLERGKLTLEQMDTLSQLADWAHQAFSQNFLRSLTGDYAANALFDLLESFTNAIEHAAKIAIKNERAKAPNAIFTIDDHEALIETLCTTHTALAVAGLSIQEAKILLTAPNANAATTARQILQAKSQSPELVVQLHNALRTSLIQRATEVDEVFHTRMTEGLNQKIEANRSKGALVYLPSGDTVPQAFWDSINTLALTMERADGTLFIDTSDWDSIDRETKLDRLEEATEEIIDEFFLGNIDKAASFFSDIPIIGPSVLSVCSDNLALSPIHLPDGTAVVKLPPKSPQHQTITLLDTEFHHLSFVSAHHITGITDVVDPKGNYRWLIPETSQIKYECHFMLTPEGNFTLSEPMHLTPHLTPGPRPIAHYPMPTAESLNAPHYAARDDLMTYAVSSGNRDHVNVLKALDALHALEENPAGNSALEFFSEFVTSGALSCLGDIGKEILPIANQLSLRFYTPLGLPLLNDIANSLLEDHFVLKQPYPLKEAWTIRYKEMASIFDEDMPDEKRAALAYKHLRTEAGAYIAPQEEISAEELIAFRATIIQTSAPLDPRVTTALKNKIGNFIAEEILPGFIASAHEESAAEQ